MLPGLGRDAQLATINSWLDEGLKDPVNGAQKIAARFGMPITPEQFDRYNAERGVISHIENAAATGQYDSRRDEKLMEIISDPRFARTGDPTLDFQRAVHHDSVIQREEARFQDVINGLFDHVGGPDTPVGKELAKLASDPVFLEHCRQANAGRRLAEMPTT